MVFHEQISESVERVAFAPGRRDLIILVSYNGGWSTLDLFEFVRGAGNSRRLEPVWTQMFDGKIGPIAISSRQIAVPIQNNNEIHLFGIDDGASLGSIPHTGTITAIQFSLLGQYLAAGSSKGFVYIFDQDGNIRWQGDAQGRVTQIVYNNSSIQVLVGTAQGRLIFFNSAPSSNPAKAHRQISLPLRNILGILELNDGWAAWSKDALVRIRNNLRFSQMRIDGEIAGVINEPRKRPLLILTDPRHTRLHMEFLPGGKGTAPKAKPPGIDDIPAPIESDQDMTMVGGRGSTNEQESAGQTGGSPNRSGTGVFAPEKHTSDRSSAPVPTQGNESPRCFIIPQRSVSIKHRQCQLVVHTAALPRPIDAGYRISEGVTGFFYDHRRDALIGPVTAKSAPEPVSMPQNAERLSQPPKIRLAILVEVGNRLSTISGAGRILHSFGLALNSNSTGELYLSNPVLEGDPAYELLSRIQKFDSESRSKQNDGWREVRRDTSKSVDHRIKPDIHRFSEQFPPNVNRKPESEKSSAERQILSSIQSSPLILSDQLRRGITVYRSQQYDSSLEAFESAIKQDPQSLVARYLAAETILKLEDRERADMQFAAAIPPLGTRVHKDEALIAGFAALRLHDYDRANDIFSKIHDADPKSKSAWFGVQIARDRGRVPGVISYPETVDVIGFPVPLHEIAGIQAYTPVKGPEDRKERYFIMPGHSSAIDAREESLIYHTPVQRSVDSGYRIVQGDIGYFYDLGRDSLSGPYLATSAPHFAQMPPDPRSERTSAHTKNGLAIPLTSKGRVEIIGNARKILDALGLVPEKTHTGEIYLADPMLEGERAKRFSGLITKPKAGPAHYKPGDYITIVSGGFKGQRARVKEIDEEMGKIVVELDGVLLPVPIPLRLQDVSKERQ